MLQISGSFPIFYVGTPYFLQMSNFVQKKWISRLCNPFQTFNQINNYPDFLLTFIIFFFIYILPICTKMAVKVNRVTVILKKKE